MQNLVATEDPAARAQHLKSLQSKSRQMEKLASDAESTHASIGGPTTQPLSCQTDCDMQDAKSTSSIEVSAISSQPTSPSASSSGHGQSTLPNALRTLKPEALNVERYVHKELWNSQTLAKLPFHRDMTMGVLPNNLEYRILPNNFPAHKVFCFMAVGVGSIHEQDHQQGLAHVVEHAVFLGTEDFADMSDLRSELTALGMSYGTDVNACTDVHQTLYTLSTPKISAGSPQHTEANATLAGESNLYRCINLLFQMCFKAKFCGAATDETFQETERKRNLPAWQNEIAAVLSETNMHESVELRLEKAYFRHFHGETALPDRLPLGTEECVRSFIPKDALQFYQDMYIPENMAIFLCGDENAHVMEATLLRVWEKHFGQLSSQWKRQREVDYFVDVSKRPGERHQPKHARMWSGPTPRECIFQDPLIPAVGIAIAAKLTSTPIYDELQLFLTFLDTVIGHILDSRIDEKYQTDESKPFLQAGWESDYSSREWCEWNVFRVATLPNNWRQGLEVSVQELIKLVTYPVETDELLWAKQSVLKACKNDAEQERAQDSGEWIEELIEDWTCGNVTRSRTETYQSFESMAPKITDELILKRAKQIYWHSLAYFDEVPPEITLPKAGMFITGPTHMPWSRPTRRGSGWFNTLRETGDQLFYVAHQFACSIGAGRKFDIGPKVVRDILKNTLKKPVPQPLSFLCPKSLYSAEELSKYIGEHPAKRILPRLWEVGKVPADIEVVHSPSLCVYHKTLKANFWSYANGATVTFMQTKYENTRCSVRARFFGGHLLESLHRASGLPMALKTMMGSDINSIKNTIVRRMLMAQAIEVSMNIMGEMVDLSFTAVPSSLPLVFEYIFALCECHPFDETAYERVREEMQMAYEAALSNLDANLADVTLGAVCPGDDRLATPNNHRVSSLNEEDFEELVTQQMRSNNLELCICGDINLALVHELSDRFIGSLEPDNTEQEHKFFSKIKRTHVINHFMRDANFKSTATITFRGFGRYDGLSEKHGNHSWRYRVWVYVEKILNERLQQVVREQQGLVYSAYCSTSHFETEDYGLLSFAFCPRPEKLSKAWDAVMSCIANFVTTEPPTLLEFEAVQRPLISDLKSSLETNDYWLSVLSGLQCPQRRKGLSDAVGIQQVYETISLEDVILIAKQALKPFPSVHALAMGGDQCMRGYVAAAGREIERKLRKQFGKLYGSPNATWEDAHWQMTLVQDSDVQKIVDKPPSTLIEKTLCGIRGYYSALSKIAF